MFEMLLKEREFRQSLRRQKMEGGEPPPRKLHGARERRGRKTRRKWAKRELARKKELEKETENILEINCSKGFCICAVFNGTEEYSVGLILESDRSLRAFLKTKASHPAQPVRFSAFLIAAHYFKEIINVWRPQFR